MFNGMFAVVVFCAILLIFLVVRVLFGVTGLFLVPFVALVEAALVRAALLRIVMLGRRRVIMRPLLAAALVRMMFLVLRTVLFVVAFVIGGI